MIADIFINAIYVQDEGLRFGLNFSDGMETIPLHQWNGAQCSDSLGYAPPRNHAVFDTICVVFLFTQAGPEVLRNQGLRAFAISARG